MPRRVAAVVVLLLTAGCSNAMDFVSAPPGTATTATTAPETTITTRGSGTTTSSTTGGPAGDIAWSSCGGDQECGTLAVPLDHADPNGPQIDIALIRIPASDPGRRIGSLLVNPGGPGGSGVEMVSGGCFFTNDICDRFDIVGFDPRGVGSSTAIECGDAVDPFLRADSDPDTPAEVADLDAKAKAVADECGAEDGDLLPHVATDDVVRDMDLMRAALDDEKLTYYGFSYGTFLGERYAELFPTRIRAVVLDGVVDPASDFRSFLRGQTVAIEASMNRVFDACDNSPSCPIDDAAATYDRVAAKVEQAPLPAGGDSVGPAEVATGAVFVTYDPTAWSALYDALADADQGDGSLLFRLADAYRSFGGFTLYAAVECTDSVHPVGAAEFDAFAAELEALSPRFGPSVANELRPCAYWPVAPTGTPGDVHGAGAPPILVVGNTGDSATPYAQAVKVAGTLEQGVLLTYEGEGHTSYGMSSCVDNAVSEYLVDLVLPADGTVCR